MHRWLTLALVLALLSIPLTLTACSLDSSPTGSDTSVETPADTSTDVTAPAPAKWVKVVSLAGSGDKKSAPFRLNGGQQKVVYVLHAADGAPSSMVAVSIGIASLTGDQVGDAIEGNGVGKGSSRCYLETGRYYLEIIEGNCTWKVTIYEKR
jgi:hypothetical protein